MKLEDEIKQIRFKNNRHKLSVNIIFSFNWMHAHSVQFFKPYGLTPQQYNVLRILRGSHPEEISIKLIKERMLDKMSDVSRIVDKLLDKGLIDRTICPEDRRQCNVSIKPAGLTLLNKIDKKIDAFDNRLSNLTDNEVDKLNTLLDKMRG